MRAPDTNTLVVHAVNESERVVSLYGENEDGCVVTMQWRYTADTDAIGDKIGDVYQVSTLRVARSVKFP